MMTSFLGLSAAASAVICRSFQAMFDASAERRPAASRSGYLRRSTKRNLPSTASCSISALPVALDQASKSFTEPGSVATISISCPDSIDLMPCVALRIGSGQDRPLASTLSLMSRFATCRSFWRLSAPSDLDEQDLAFADVDEEGGHPLDAINHGVEIRLLELEECHGSRAGLDVDLADLFGGPHGFRPVSTAGPGDGIHGRPARLPCFRCKAMVGVDPIGPEGIQRPILQEDLDRPAERSGARGQYCGRLQLVVGTGEENDRDGFVHLCPQLGD